MTGAARRLVRAGEEYDGADDVDLEQVTPAAEPDVSVQGEPWGWTKPGPRPASWREDGQYGPRDGEDERRRAGEQR